MQTTTPPPLNLTNIVLLSQRRILQLWLRWWPRKRIKPCRRICSTPPSKSNKPIIGSQIRNRGKIMTLNSDLMTTKWVLTEDGVKLLNFMAARINKSKAKTKHNLIRGLWVTVMTKLEAFRGWRIKIRSRKHPNLRKVPNLVLIKEMAETKIWRVSEE